MKEIDWKTFKPSTGIEKEVADLVKALHKERKTQLQQDKRKGDSMKWKVTWWIHGAGRITRGHDIIEARKLDIYDAEQLIEKDLEKELASVVVDSFTPKFPKFHKQHADLMCEDRHSEISNWGIIAVNKI